ncbi:stage II sporulation protein E [Thermosyntropha sp.]|uniref:stage II sporulation protein E n=1 Tax=Thermosyntropha sp. TaxID=2740820 RepID=UPI0025D91449|nr:stage II sporulation protein E [Thermosyntropha sp.]MBO8159758.1 stage II sporulation protein E [Thermosyntropha sp.]
MLDRLEVYPYQRIAEPSPWGRRTKNREKKALRRQVRESFFTGEALRGGNWAEIFTRFFTTGNLLLAAGVFLMARAFILEEIMPFVFAFAAVFSRYRKEQAIVLGFLGCIGFATVLDGVFLGTNILALLLLLGIINYLVIPQDKLWWSLPALTAAVLFTIKSLLNMALGFSFYQEMVIVFEAMITGILTFIFMVADETVRQKKELANFTFEDICAFLVLCIGIVMGLEEISIAGMSVGAVICRLGILIAAFIWGSGVATMVGVMTGIIPSISSSVFAPTLGMYAVSGLLAGLFRNFGRLGIIIGFMLGTLALSMFVPQTQATILGLWETGIACIIFFMLPSSIREKMPVKSLGGINAVFSSKETEIADIKIKEAAKEKIEELAAVFEEIGSSFAYGNDLRRYNNQQAYLNYLYDQIANGFCRSCSRCDSCWGIDSKSTSEELLDIFALIEAKGEILYEELPVEFRRRCIYGREMLTTVHYLFETLRLNEYWIAKLGESREVVSKQLKEAGNIIRNLADEFEIKTVVDWELKKHLQKESKKLGLSVINVTPVKIGDKKLKINVVADACKSGEECEVNLSSAISSIVGEKMEVCSKKCPRITGKGRCEFTLTPSHTYKVVSGAAQLGKESICGDTFTLATLEEGKEVVILSDGMGVGEKAYAESQIAVRLLESLINSGFSKETALKTVNSIMLLRSKSESFATLDIAMIDLYTAEVDFIKTGSAPSFIKRGRKVEIIEADNLPVGIMDEIEVSSQTAALCPYDILVMVSDGILEASGDIIEGEKWLKELLAKTDCSDPQKLAEIILNRALTICEGKPLDDMTVICAYIDLNFPH